MAGAPPAQPARARLAPALAAAIVTVTLLNGSATYLRRVGLVDGALYDAAWAKACGAVGTTDVPFGLGRRCAPLANGTPAPVSDDRNEATGYVYATNGRELVLKLAKDLFFAVTVGIGVAAGGFRMRMPAFPRWPLWGAAALIGLLAAKMALQGEWTAVLCGARSFLFVAVALFGSWAASDSSLGIIAKGMTLLLGLELALMPIELARGLPLHRQLPFWSLPGRMAGTLVMPNSLGVLAAVGLAFVVCFVPAHGWRITAAFLAAVLVALSGSATGWVVLALLAAVLLACRVRFRPMIILTAAGAAVALGLLLLPRLVNRREDLFDSIKSRQTVLLELVSHPVGDVLFGQRLGAGSNTEVTIDSVRAGAWPKRVYVDPGPGDSLLASVLRQTGIVGLAFLVSVVAGAAVRDVAARPFLLAVAAAALVSNLGEIFPANLLLGLVLARRSKMG